MQSSITWEENLNEEMARQGNLKVCCVGCLDSPIDVGKPSLKVGSTILWFGFLDYVSIGKAT